jgi:hypothetical protein
MTDCRQIVSFPCLYVNSLPCPDRAQDSDAKQLYSNLTLKGKRKSSPASVSACRGEKKDSPLSVCRSRMTRCGPDLHLGLSLWPVWQYSPGPVHGEDGRTSAEGEPQVVTGGDRSDRWPVNIGRKWFFRSDRLVTGTAFGSDRPQKRLNSGSYATCSRSWKRDAGGH